jgi:hypothetical protein
MSGRGKGGKGLGNAGKKRPLENEGEDIEDVGDRGRASFIAATQPIRLVCDSGVFVLRNINDPSEEREDWPEYSRSDQTHMVLAALWSLEPAKLVAVTFLTESEIGTCYDDSVDLTELFATHENALECMGANFEEVIPTELFAGSVHALSENVEVFLN